MPLVAEYDTKRDEVKRAVHMLAMKGLLDSKSGKELKESLDIEYVYYEASIIMRHRLSAWRAARWTIIVATSRWHKKNSIARNLHQKDLQ
jgi:hypothetical protein